MVENSYLPMTHFLIRADILRNNQLKIKGNWGVNSEMDDLTLQENKVPKIAAK